MTPAERQQSLENARKAIAYLKSWILPELGEQGSVLYEYQACLVAEFERLDAKEQKQIRAGSKGRKYGKLGAVHGVKGGRPRKNGGKK